MTPPPSTRELIEQLGLSKSNYYRLKKAGKLDDFLAEKDGGHSPYIEDWVKWREAGLHVRPWSQTYKRNQLMQLSLYFKRYKLISHVHLGEWLSELAPEKHSNRKDRHAAVSSFARYLALMGILTPEESPKIKALYPKKPLGYQPDQRVIYAEQLEKLLETSLDGHSRYQTTLNHTLLIFLSESALRVSEACSLTIADLCFSQDPRQASIKVRRGKGGKSRLVPFSYAAQQIIRDYLRILPSQLQTTQSLFWSFNPKHGYTPLTSDCIRRRFHLISEKSRIRFSAHSLRHFRITQWANNPRIPITVVQKWAGHSSLEVTQKYIHIRDEDALMAAF